MKRNNHFYFTNRYVITSSNNKGFFLFSRLAKILTGVLEIFRGSRFERDGEHGQNTKLCKGLIIIFFIISCGYNILGCRYGEQKNDEKNYLIKIGDAKLSTNEFHQIFDIVKMGYSRDISRIETNIAEYKLLVNLAEEMILLNEAKKFGIGISEKELNEEINDIKKDYPNSLFELMFIENAISFEVWKKRLETQLIIKKLISSNLLKNVTILSDDIRKYYETEYNKKENRADEAEDDKKIVKYLRNKKAEDLYNQWFENFNKSYEIEINKSEWEKIFGE